MEARSISNLANLGKALSSPLRLKILHTVIREGKVNVSLLVNNFRKSYPLISQQLRILTAAYILIRKKEGKKVYYVLASPERERRLPKEVFGAIKNYLSRIEI